MTHLHKELVQQFVEEVINKGNLDAAHQFMHDDVVELVPLPGQGRGVEGVKDVVRDFRNAFPDLHFAIREQISEDGKVLSRIEWTGTHRGDFLGMPATGKAVRVDAMAIDRFVDNKIQDTRFLMDTLSLLQQLGAA